MFTDFLYHGNPSSFLSAKLVEEYVNGDNYLSVCVDMDDDQWDENFLVSLTVE